MNRHHAKNLGLAFLALAAGLLGGCGGESGGVPSGLGATLQGVTVRTNVISLSISSDTVGSGGSVLPEVVTGVNSSGIGTTQNPTRFLRTRIKGAGPTSADVVFDVSYKKGSDFPASNDLLSAQPNGGVVPMDALRCYIFDESRATTDRPVPPGTQPPSFYPLSAVALENNNRLGLKLTSYTSSSSQSNFAFLVKRQDPTSNAKFVYAGFPLVKSNDTKTNARIERINADLALLNAADGAMRDAFATIAQSVVQYLPRRGVPMKRGTFDVSVEFFATDLSPAEIDSIPVGQSKPAPFYVSYLKGAATVTSQDVTIRPASISGDDAFDPTRRFSKPVSATVDVSGFPADAQYFRVRVRELQTDQVSGSVTYERVLSLASTEGTTTRTLSFTVINRLNPLVAQVEAFLSPPTSSGSTTGGAAADAPAIAVGRSNLGGLQIGPDRSVAPFEAIVMSPLTTGLTVVAPSNPLFVPFLTKQSVAVRANLRQDTTNVGPFDPIPANTLVLPLSLADASTNASAYVVTGTEAFTQTKLTYVPSTATEGTLQTTINVDVNETFPITFTVTGLTPAPLTASLSVNAGIANLSQKISAKVTNLPTSGTNGAAKSVVVIATEAGSGLTYKAINNLTDAASVDSVKFDVSVTDRKFAFTLAAQVFSELDGAGTLLASGSFLEALPGGSFRLKEITPSQTGEFAVTNLITNVALTYDGLRYPTDRLVRGVQYVPNLTVNGGVAPAKIFTYSASPSGVVDIDPANGSFTVIAPDGQLDTPVTLTATYKGAAVSASQPLVVGPDQYKVSAAKVRARIGAVRYSLSEVGGTQVYTGLLNGVPSTNTATLVVANRAKNYLPRVDLFSNDDGTGVVLSSQVAPAYAFTTGTSTSTLAADLDAGNLVSDVSGASVSGVALENYTFTMGRTYTIDPILTVAGVNQPVPVKLVDLSKSGARADLITLNADNTITIVTDSAVKTAVDATITIEYRLFGQGAADPARRKTFGVHIRAASGGVGGTVG